MILVAEASVIQISEKNMQATSLRSALLCIDRRLAFANLASRCDSEKDLGRTARRSRTPPKTCSTTFEDQFKIANGRKTQGWLGGDGKSKNKETVPSDDGHSTLQHEEEAQIV